MEFEVVVEDFQRLLKDNERNWSILDKSFDQLETDNLSGKEIAPQVSQKNFLVFFFRSQYNKKNLQRGHKNLKIVNRLNWGHHISR